MQVATQHQQMIRRKSEKNDTLDFDLSEIRQPSVYLGGGQNQMELSFIPEIIEFSNNTHAVESQKLTKESL